MDELPGLIVPVEEKESLGEIGLLGDERLAGVPVVLLNPPELPKLLGMGNRLVDCTELLGSSETIAVLELLTTVIGILDIAAPPEEVVLRDIIEPLEEERLFDKLAGVLDPRKPPDEDMLLEIDGEFEPTAPPKEDTSVLNDGEELLVVICELAVTEAVAEGEMKLPGTEDELPDPPKLPAEKVMSPDTEDELLGGGKVAPVSVDEVPIRPLLP